MSTDCRQRKVRKPRLVLVATYLKLSSLYSQIVANHTEVEASSILAASMDDAVAYAVAHEAEADVFLTRGGPTDLLTNAVNVPVVEIPIMPFDVIAILHSLGPPVSEVALIHYRKRIHNIQDIARMYHITIHEYVFSRHEEILQAIHDANEKGVSVIIGGGVAVEYAHKVGLRGYEIGASEYNVNLAIEKALQIFRETQVQANRTTRLKAVLDSLSEGVIVTDPSCRVILNNPAAEKLLGKGLLAGQPLDSRFLDEKYKSAMEKKEQVTDYLFQNGGTSLAASHRPVFLNQEFLGLVSKFSDVTKIQKLEKRIRSELHTKGFEARYTFADILTRDTHMESIKSMAAILAQTDSAVLIEGESGTGKELMAQSIHNASPRACGPFVAINCSAIPENLLESELFGYDSGAFTGAKKDGKPGYFELAHAGTIFLDEIGELPLHLQARLLRVLQEREVIRVGGSRVIPVDVRVISATNQNLLEYVRDKTFRMDLYFRLNVFHIQVPPLRERLCDIPFLAERFLRDYAETADIALPDSFLEKMMTYHWPGNIRELRNVIERFAVLNVFLQKEDITMEEVFPTILGACERTEDTPEDAAKTSVTVEADYSRGLKACTQMVEKQIVEQLMKQHQNDCEKVAQLLKIGKTTLWRKTKEGEDPQ